jgi:hypothetical protein
MITGVRLAAASQVFSKQGMFMRSVRSVAIVGAFILYAASTAYATPLAFNGAGDNQVDGWYYAISGGKFPTGTDPNGTRQSGGTFARIWDDAVAWGSGIDTWTRDGWFPENAGMAFTLYDGTQAVYDNNGIDDGTYGNFYSAKAQGITDNDATPGLHQMYSNANNWDMVYATYFKLDQDTLVTSINTFFNFDGLTGDFNPLAPTVGYLINVWSVQGNCQLDNVGCLPVNTGSFVGDVLSSNVLGGAFGVSDSGAVREFADGHTDAIGRLTWTLPQSFTLPAGEYYFSAAALIEQPVPEPATVVMLGVGLIGIAAIARARHFRKSPRV